MQPIAPRFSSLHLFSIQPGKTAYYTGSSKELGPGKVVNVIQSLVPKRPMDDDLLLIDEFDLHSRWGHNPPTIQQEFIVDEYTIQPDESARLTAKGKSTRLGFDLYTGINEYLARLTLTPEGLQVED